MKKESNGRLSRPKAFHITVGIALVLLICSTAFASPPEVTRFTLKNGIRVVILYAGNCKTFAAISYLPLGLAADGKTRTQWCHLIEHLTLYTTGPITNYMERNAEAMPQGMHLDFVGTTREWEKGLDLQAKWLSGLAFREEILRGQAGTVLPEIEAVSARLATHKFAIAGWNQVFRHGESDVNMRGALESAKLNEVQEYRNRHLVILNRVVLCIISGIKPEKLRPMIDKRFGSIKSIARELPPAVTKSGQTKQQSATWDLNVTHYIETYAIPNPDSRDYPALYVAAMLLYQYFLADEELKQWTGMVLSGADLFIPEGTYLYISASLKPGADVNKVKARIERQLDRLRQANDSSEVMMVANALSIQMRGPVDMDIVKQYKSASMPEAMLIGNVGLQWGMLEFEFRDTLPSLARRLATVSGPDVASVAREYLSKDKRSTLILKPKR